MEDLWCVQNSGIEMDEFADLAEYKSFLKRFCLEEEQEHQRRLLFGDETTGKQEHISKV